MALSEDADFLWRAMVCISVAQVHLKTVPRSLRWLPRSDMKEHASGHWGTVPGVAWALTHVGLAGKHRAELEIVPVIGSGHAGVVQFALAWLTGDLALVDSKFSRDLSGLSALIASFPDIGGLGSEVHPALPAGCYVGGWLGGALAFAQGMALDSSNRVVVPILGDGECETPTTAASWLAHRTLLEGHVLPVVHLNEHRMGGISLLGAMTDEEVHRYALGLGWRATIAHVKTGDSEEHDRFHSALMTGIDATARGDRQVIFLRCQKGWSGPLGAHKTPLTNLRNSSSQRRDLRQWLARYRPNELVDDEGRPRCGLEAAVRSLRLGRPSRPFHSLGIVAPPRGQGFSAEVSAVLRVHAAAGDFRVFSPDELSSNRLDGLSAEPWITEVLAEEVLLGWLAGWTASGRRGLLISYEAFAPLLLAELMSQLKQRRLSGTGLPSINLLLTSYGWHNVYTHGDPSLITALLGAADTALHVLTPADSNRVALALDDALRSTDRLNVIIAGKHATESHPRDTLDEERQHGLAIWHHLSDPGEPDLTLVCAGDLAASAVSCAMPSIRDIRGCAIRVVNIHDLTVLANASFEAYLGKHAKLLVVTLGHPAAIWGLLAGRMQRRIGVVGWREPPFPMSSEQLIQYAGLDVKGILASVAELFT